MKVLIISHNPLSTYQSMGKTMASLFSCFDKNELCQLYIYPSYPDVDMCNSYLRITDVDALKGIFRFKVLPSCIIPQNYVKSCKSSFVYGNDKNRSHIRELTRDFVWKISPWFRKSLKEWLDAEHPTYIFVAPGRGKFLYDMAIKISDYLKAPIVSYICDDYYNLKNEKSLLGIIWQQSLRNKIKKLLKKSKQIITVCDEMSDLYKKEFNCKVVTFMTGSNIKIASEISNPKKISSITYMGNISLNRYKSLVDIAQALESVADSGDTCYLDVYTKAPSSEIKNIFSTCKLLRLHDFVTGDEYNYVFNHAEAFLHVEAFDERSIDRVKNSVSTKIADILASGKPVFAYGPKGIASINHLIRNSCALVVNDKINLKVNLYEFINNSAMRENIINNALMTAKKFHYSEITSNKLKNILNNIKYEDTSN